MCHPTVMRRSTTEGTAEKTNTCDGARQGRLHCRRRRERVLGRGQGGIAQGLQSAEWAAASNIGRLPSAATEQTATTTAMRSGYSKRGGRGDSPVAGQAAGAGGGRRSDLKKRSPAQ